MTALYRLYDDADILLYVGVATNLPRRLAQHSTEKPWWGEVHSIKSTTLPDRESARRAEQEAIATESPRWNVVHNPDPLPTGRRGRGRPPVGKPVEVRLPPEVLAHVDAWADAEGVTRAEAIRRLLDASLDHDHVDR